MGAGVDPPADDVAGKTASGQSPLSMGDKTPLADKTPPQSWLQGEYRYVRAQIEQEYRYHRALERLGTDAAWERPVADADHVVAEAEDMQAEATAALTQVQHLTAAASESGEPTDRAGAPSATDPKCLFGPSLVGRVHAWTALYDRLPQGDTGDQTPAAAEVQTLRWEYDHLRAWQSGLVGKVLGYQACWILIFSLLAFIMTVWPPTEAGQSYNFFADPVVRRYLACAYWGAMGACIASIWEVITHAAARRLRMDAFPSHLARPLLGALLGPVVIQLLFLKYIAPAKEVDAGAAATAYGIATIAGMNERLIIQKVKDVATALFGVNPDNHSQAGSASWLAAGPPGGPALR